MQKIALIDPDDRHLAVLQRFIQSDALSVALIVSRDDRPASRGFADANGILYSTDPAEPKLHMIQTVLDLSPAAGCKESPACVSGSASGLLFSLLDQLHEREQTNRTYSSILRTVREGILIVSKDGTVELLNDSASKMIGCPFKQAAGKPVTSIIPSFWSAGTDASGQMGRTSVLTLPDGDELWYAIYPLYDTDGAANGAFALFRELPGIRETEEEIDELKRVKTMLEAIIHSSEDAISVVDADGLGILVNPAYTRLTGLSEKEVIGKPATADISSGESIHMKVLETERPVRGVNMRIGEDNRDVIVNVAPIIVDDEVKGSVGVIHDITEMRSLMRQLDQAKAMIRDLESTYTFEDIIGQDEDLQIAVSQAKIAAASEIPVMLRGEPGTGKELFAHAIHTGSVRSGNDFIRVPCGSLEMESVEMALFHTGAEDSQLSGTLYLDEITDLKPEIQSRLLEFLESGGVPAAGGKRGFAMRIIASSSANLERAVHDGTLSEDLYFQLTRISIRIPALRRRAADIPAMTGVLLAMLNSEFGMSVDSLTDQALRRLQSYSWPGNVRELENVLSRAMILSEPGSGILDEEDILRALSSGAESPVSKALPDKRTLASLMEDHEKLLLESALKECKGQKVAAADKLGISLRSLYYKLEKYKLI